MGSPRKSLDLMSASVLHAPFFALTVWTVDEKGTPHVQPNFRATGRESIYLDWGILQPALLFHLSITCLMYLFQE
ncbi:hypothetical protein BO70DRAFT_364636 [Aspergillus heteromorphus CBS 117.55]|uniref:Uncharacterized protein n=1 Tax=Aspergillus heteromorphus CBS 117.55 TaxID=1448321 RepID=A0A317VLA5_9EURO|nr:uncharacterized protein BO70DRAFT_364636 [Aspergillus heteromorphus CBS 117.55]PWY73718.1 hypothetical protein BO70DRAFT_364636 [Aspergillus heteromorphus CBS 117.55]